MHIGIDASRYNNTEQKTGVEIYSHYIIPGIVERALKDGHRITLYTPCKIPTFPKEMQCVLPMKRFWSLIRLSSFFTQKELHPDVLFVPSHILPPIAPQHAVVTIHDIAFRHFPKAYSFLERSLLTYSVKHAKKHNAHILTVSQSTKNDLMELYNFTDTQITVTPLGYQKQPTPEETTIRKTLHLHESQYLVYLGRIEEKKNCTYLIEEFLNAQLYNTTLVLIGKPGHGGEKIIKKYQHHPQIIFTGYLSNEDTHTLLAHGEALCLPSLYEGFGMPILEAYQHKLPVITSNNSAMPEVAGPGALLIDPSMKGSLTKAIQKLHNDQILQKHLGEQGFIHAQKYTWEQTIQQTYEALLEKPNIT